MHHCSCCDDRSWRANDNSGSEEERGCCETIKTPKKAMKILASAICIIVPAVMIVLGAMSMSSESCRGELPLWLLVGGITGLITTICFLLVGIGLEFGFLHVWGLSLLFHPFWFGYGCYLAWTSAFGNLPISQQCSGTVTWFSFCLTVAPFVLVFCFCCCVCVRGK